MATKNISRSQTCITQTTATAHLQLNYLMTNFITPLITNDSRLRDYRKMFRCQSCLHSLKMWNDWKPFISVLNIHLEVFPIYKDLAVTLVCNL